MTTPASPLLKPQIYNSTVLVCIRSPNNLRHSAGSQPGAIYCMCSQYVPSCAKCFVLQIFLPS